MDVYPSLGLTDPSECWPAWKSAEFWDQPHFSLLVVHILEILIGDHGVFNQSEMYLKPSGVHFSSDTHLTFMTAGEGEHTEGQSLC